MNKWFYNSVAFWVIGGFLGLSVCSCNSPDRETETVKVDTLTAYQVPDTWRKYVIKESFSISVPNTVELRSDLDKYTKQMKAANVWSYNDSLVVFQQKDLSKGANNDHYCRILLSHIVGNEGDYLHHDEVEPLDSETISMFKEMVNAEVVPYVLLSEPTYSWIDIDGTKAVEIKYRRGGSDNYTTSCTMYLLFNNSEAVKMIVSYREQEKELWMPDFANIIRTFRWTDGKSSVMEDAWSERNTGNYSIKYPKGWNVVMGTDGLTDVFIGNPSGELVCSILFFDTDYSLSEVVEECNSNARKTGFKVVSNKSVRINGQDCYKTVYDFSLGNMEGRQISFMFKKNGKIFNLKFGNLKHIVEENADLIERIVGTFEMK